MDRFEEWVMAGIVAIIAAVLVGVIWVSIANIPPADLHGPVLGKDHHAPWVQMLPITTCYSDGKTVHCNITSYVPISHPESWTLAVQDCSQANCRTYWVDVPQAEWETYSLGDQYPRS